MKSIKKKCFFKMLVALILLFSASKTAVAQSKLNSKSVIKEMERVADWQLKEWDENGMKYPKWDWTNATTYAGIKALSTISTKLDYDTFLIKIGTDLNWNTGPNRFFADDYCIGQTYSILYSKYKEPKMIVKWQTLADSIVQAPHTESLEWKNKIHKREWAWCDALFMGPPALAYLSTATSNLKYLDTATKLWWKTTEFLYDESAHLYSRDGSYLNKKEKNGEKVFWSRGNGWVMGGLVRMLENMPENYPDKQRFQNLYKNMAKKVISLQQADGSWHASLLDPQSFNIKETSGTGFYCYALTWGMNNGLLDKKETWPIVKKAWSALSTSIKKNGMLGYVQPIGASPDMVNENSTEVYGTGAFLLAGSELYYFLKSNKSFK